MEELISDSYDVSKNSFDVLSFERKLVELVEELRLRRNLEIESEKTLKSFMDEKYKAELEWDEQQRKHVSEKADYEQQITLLKRKLEDKVCVSDDEKAKQDLVNKTYSQEIRVLKEELRNSNSEKLKFVKRIQELEGQLKLHNNFQETIVKQIGDIRKRAKTLTDVCTELRKAQESVKDNVTEIKTNYSKFDVCYNHLKESIAIAEKKNESLMKELIITKSEIAVLKKQNDPVEEKSENLVNSEMLQEKNLELQNLLLFSRKENEKTLQNLVESNKLLCKFMNKYNDAQEHEKSLSEKIKRYETEESVWKAKIEELQMKLSNLEESNKNHDLLKEQTSNTMANIESPKENTFETNDIQSNGTKLVNDGTRMEKDQATGLLISLRKPNEYSKEESKPEQCTSVVRKENFKLSKEMPTFNEVVKRKFSDINDPESFAVPFKKPNRDEEQTCSSQSKFEAEDQRFIDEILSSVPSSQNSVEDIFMSQEENKENDSTAANKIGDQVREIDTIDLANVQLNMRELKVDDACTNNVKDKKSVSEVDSKKF